MGKLELEFQNLFEMMRVDILENELALSKYLSLLINFLPKSFFNWLKPECLLLISRRQLLPARSAEMSGFW